MRIKLDENLDPRLVSLFTEAEDLADTVLGEGIRGCSDEKLFSICQSEELVLITLDLDFSNPVRFPPDQTAGIVILRPHRPILALIRETLVKSLPILRRQSLSGKL